jgi:hypothetical protein
LALPSAELFFGAVNPLLRRLDPQALVVSDSHAAYIAYIAFAGKHKFAHEAVNLRVGMRLTRLGNHAIHVQNVNDHHQRSKAWLLVPFLASLILHALTMHGFMGRQPSHTE